MALLALGYSRVPANDMLLDLQFGSAWRSWAYRNRFPRVETDINQGLHGSIALTRASVRSCVIFYWDRDRDLEIHCRLRDWDPDDPEDRALALSYLDGDVPWEGWIELAQAFASKRGL